MIACQREKKRVKGLAFSAADSSVITVLDSIISFIKESFEFLIARPVTVSLASYPLCITSLESLLFRDALASASNIKNI